jgi:hypothetical protein
LIDTTDVAEARGERVRVGQVAADDVDAAQSAVGPPLPLRDDGERVSATTLDALPPVGVKWEHGVPSRHARERLFPDTLVSVGGCGDVFDGDVDVGELGAGQGGDVAVDDRAYCLDEVSSAGP